MLEPQALHVGKLQILIKNYNSMSELKFVPRRIFYTLAVIFYYRSSYVRWRNLCDCPSKSFRPRADPFSSEKNLEEMPLLSSHTIDIIMDWASITTPQSRERRTKRNS